MHYVVSEDTRIKLDGQTYLLQKGDRIEILSEDIEDEEEFKSTGVASILAGEDPDAPEDPWVGFGTMRKAAPKDDGEQSIRTGDVDEPEPTQEPDDDDDLELLKSKLPTDKLRTEPIRLTDRAKKKAATILNHLRAMSTDDVLSYLNEHPKEFNLLMKAAETGVIS